jgi:hypothetical protein
MKPHTTSTRQHDRSTVTHFNFDVDDSSALHYLSITSWKFSHTGRHETTVHILYKSNPEVRYLYAFNNAAATADLYIALMGEDSAGKFANYVRENADTVTKHEPSGLVKHLPARKTLAKETA